MQTAARFIACIWAIRSGTAEFFDKERRCMRRVFGILLFASVGLSACVTAPSSKKISDTPVAPVTLNVAEKAVGICGQTFPNLNRAIDSFMSSGFTETGQRFKDDKELQDSSGQVRIQLGERPAGRGRKEHVCLISVIGMSPEQGFALVQPWVRQYNAITNAEAGQELSPRAVQAWQSMTPSRIAFIAARKANDTFRQAGASDRLIIIQ